MLEKDWTGIIVVALVIALIGGVIGFAIGVWQSGNLNLSPAGPDPRMEFLRGAYMVCQDFVTEVFGVDRDGAREFCNTKLMARLIEEDWYGQTDSGFILPTEEP